jgi:asparagine synthase (glutamine-hydrolysing)
VLLCLFEKYDVDAITRLNGMFAFAIYDRDTRTLLLARDRLGIKRCTTGRAEQFQVI